MESKLNINPSVTFSGVADFQNSYIQFKNSVTPSAANGKILKWKMWLDQEDNYSDNWVWQFSASFGGDGFLARLDSSVFEIIRNGITSGAKQYSIIGYSNRILDCEIEKSLNSINSFKINGVEQISSSSTWQGASYNPGIYISKNDRRLSNASIWDVEIIDTDDNNKIIHSWKGYPDGDTISAWTDDVSTMNATFETVPSTRNITGVDSGGDIFSNTNKLNLKLPKDTLPGVADFNDDMYVRIALDSPNPSIQYGKRLEWKMYIDAESGYVGGNDVLFALIGNSAASDQIRMQLDGSLLKMRSNSSGGLFYALEGLSNKVLNCAVEKSYGIIESFSLDGEIQTPIYSGFWGAGGDGGLSIGKGNLADLHNATVWDVKIYDTSTAGSPLIHSWKGYPAGNTAAAWVDDVGTLDGDLIGIGSTRDIESSGSGDVLNSSRKLFIGKIVVPPVITTNISLESSINYTEEGRTPMNGLYYNNYMPQIFVPAGGTGSQEQIAVIGINSNGIMTHESSVAYSYPGTQTELNGILYISKLFSAISSFYINPGTGEISKWKDNNSPIVLRQSQTLASTKGKLISSKGMVDSDIEVYSYTPDASGTLTRDSSLTFSTTLQEVRNHRLISGENFVYLMRIDENVVVTDILTINNNVLTDTGYDVSILGDYDDIYFEGFENNGNLYLSYNGIGITKHSINQTTGEPTFVIQTDASTVVGLYSNIVGNKLINESNDTLSTDLRFIKSFDLDTFKMDGSLLRSGSNQINGSGIITIDNSTFVTSSHPEGVYILESFSLSFT